MHPGINGRVDVVECKGHHHTTPEDNVVHNGLFGGGEEEPGKERRGGTKKRGEIRDRREEEVGKVGEGI